MPVKVAIIDSAIGPKLERAVDASMALRLAADGEVLCVPGEHGDAFGHGSAVAHLVLARAPACRLLSAQVFHGARPSAARVIGAAIDWCVESGARVINLSLGLLEDRAVLRHSCQDAIAHGVLLVASSPARGAPVYPANYPGVVAVCGDIRCDDADCSHLVHDVLFGASPRPPQCFPGGGASYAAARVAGQAAAYFDSHPGAAAVDFRAHLLTSARFHGRERRQSNS